MERPRRLINCAAAAIWPSRDVVDIGPGIRPQCFIEAARALCIEPHDEYAEWLRRHGHEVVQATAQEALPGLGRVDTIFLLDVIEHLEKADGVEVLRLAVEKAAQVVVFTPLGFLEQRYEGDQRDGWGMNGQHWQTHRSGWTLDEFPGWLTLADPAFFGSRGGAFFAIWQKT